MMMDAINQAWISSPVRHVVDTRVDNGPVADRRAESWQRGWEEVESNLITWGWDASQFKDEELTPPSRETVAAAYKLAAKLSRTTIPAPTRVVPDVRGGIAFEFQQSDGLMSVHVHANGTQELRVFRNHRLEIRSPL